MTARKSTLQLVLNLLTLLVLLAPLASPWALSQPAPVSAAPLPEEQNAPPLAASFDAWTDLFRAWVTLSQPTSRARLDTLGVVVLEETETQALILADGEQLETLARLRFQPQASEDLGMLVEHHAQATPWLAESLQPLLAQGRSARALSTDTGSHAGRVLNTRDAQALQQAQTDLRLTLQSLSIEQQAGIMNMTTIDSDGDGLTDTEEYWWCTDPLNPDTKGDGVSDGAAVAALMAWMRNERPGPPASGTPFLGWPMVPGDGQFNPNCVDQDRDSVPDLAERWMLGLNPNRESTSRYKFDDGQKLFGITAWGWGALPRTEDTGIIFAEMPSWVRAPGNHPLVAAFPVPEIDVMPSSLRVETVTVVTTDHTISEGEERSYSTARTTGTSTSIADTVTWNDWQEVSRTEPATAMHYGYSSEMSWPRRAIHSASEIVETYCGATFGTQVFTGVPQLDFALEFGCFASDAGTLLGEGINHLFFQGGLHGPRVMQYLSSVGENINLLQQKAKTNFLNIHESIKSGSVGSLFEFQAHASGSQDITSGLSGHLFNIEGDEIRTSPTYQIMYPVQRATVTSSYGKSWGGARTNTHTQYEEHTITNGEAFFSSESWSIATAVDSAHAADLWFTYQVRNTGTEYAREIANLAFNIYIGNDPNPAITYFVAPDLGGDGKFHNFMPGEEHTYTSRRIPLSLEQMKAIDLGGPLRVVVEDFSYGIDELFYQDALNAGVLIAIDDGAYDGQETIKTYVLPTWGEETVLDVMGRYFPHTTDVNDKINAIWTPHYRADTPSWCNDPRIVGSGSRRTLWCKNALSIAEWWTIYTNGMGDGTEGLQDTLASPGSMALFRFNRDSDLDGYSDRSEIKLGTDPYDPASHPSPELLAGVRSIRVGDVVTATLSLLNTGLYDAYGIEAIMVAPNDTISITYNTVGGSGRVRALQGVVVGSRILQPGYTAATWRGTARPFSAGYYSGDVDRVYTFTALDSAPVSAGTLRLQWADGMGASGTLNLGAGYASPRLLDVAQGLQVGMVSGSIQAGDTFTVAARTPRDTFQYTINQEPYTPPVVIVSYNDPQGNHRFVIPPTTADLSDPVADLVPYAGQMLYDIGVEIVTNEPFNPGSNTTDLVVNNPTAVTFEDAHLFLTFIDITGTVASEVPFTVTLEPGPNVVPVLWDTDSFSPTFQADSDYIVMAFWTDWQGNILDTAGRPLSSFQDDPRPRAVMPAAIWDFGTATQGEVLRHTLTLANTGFRDLLTYVDAPAEMNIQQGHGRIDPADTATYDLTLNTTGIPAGAYNATVTLRSNDPQQPVTTVQVTGVITDAIPGVSIVPDYPLDLLVTIPGTHSQGEWIQFTHPLGPEPMSLHPVRVLSNTTELGFGRYASGFSGSGVASGAMFGDGRDGDLVISSNTTFSPHDANVSGTVGTKLLNLSNQSSGFAANVGDKVLIHQTRGSGAGQYEISTVVSYSSGTMILADPITFSPRHSATASHPDKAQLIVIPQYHNVTINTGMQLTTKVWNGFKGGVVVFFANGTVIVNGTISAAGGNGIRSTTSNGVALGATGPGFAGGHGHRPPSGESHVRPFTGESQLGPSLQGDSNQGGAGLPTNGSAGTAAAFNNGGLARSGGGGSYGALGNPGTASRAGIPVGDNLLTELFFGGGGGGGGRGSNVGVGVGSGGSGGGIIAVLAANMLIDGGNVTARGGNAGIDTNTNGQATEGGGASGGAGAGGSILLRVRNANLGENRIIATGGTGTSASGGRNGQGGAGRIRVEYCESLTGTASPTASTQKLDCYIVEQIETSPYTESRLSLPEPTNGGVQYRVPYARRQVFEAAGEYTTTLRIPVGHLNAATLDALISEATAGDLTFKLDIGNDGTWNWETTQTFSGPVTLNSPDLAAAFNTYWQGQGAPQSGVIDVPVRISMSKAGQVLLTNLHTPLVPPDVALSTGDITFDAITPVETDLVPLTVTLHNLGGRVAGGHTIAVYADTLEWGERYIGSAFVPEIPVNGTAQASILWDTQGFIGEVPVRVVADPYNRLVESNKDNNQATASLTILTRPDLHPTFAEFSNPEPVAGETITVFLQVENLGQAAAGDFDVELYDGNPADDGILLQTVNLTVPGEGETVAPFTWTPTAPGPHRLFVQVDKARAINESNRGNNLAWQDIYVGFAGPLLLDSGGASEPAYSANLGYGVLDKGPTDVLGACGVLPHERYRLDPAGRVVYRFDHLLPGHFYHLDVTLYECDGASRQQTIRVNGHQVAGPLDLGDGQVHRLSLLLDPALYSGHTIRVEIEAAGIDGAVVNEVNLYDVDYRYADAGGPRDPQYPGGALANLGRPYGWLNGVANTAWGTLPSRSVRVNQTSNLLQYRFDGLRPEKRYNVHLSFWQPSGAARIQRIQLDGLDTGITVNTGDYQLHRETIAVPPTTYAADGSVVVGILRINAATGAMVNEIALEEETLPRASWCSVQQTPYFTDVYGDVAVLGQGALPGTVIEARNPRGDTVGCFVVGVAGQYGFMRIYGEDTTALPAIPGMRAGELVAFRVNGAPAAATPQLYWQADYATHRVDLNAGSITGQSILLQAGWNLMSFRLEPPVPTVRQVLDSIDGRYDRVLGETGAYAPAVPDVFNTLKELHPGLGYYVRIPGSTSASVLIEGLTVPVTTPIPLHPGWNWIGYLPEATLPITVALQSIAGQYQRVLSLDKTYDPALPGYSTLHSLEPGKGYLIYANQAVTLTYPTGSGLLNVTPERVATSGCGNLNPTPQFTLLYGDLLLGDRPAPAGSRVEVLTPRGEVAGCFVLQKPGIIGFMQVYGEDAALPPTIAGFRAGEPLAFRVNGIPVEIEAQVWQDDWTPHAIMLRADYVQVYLPLVLRGH